MSGFQEKPGFTLNPQSSLQIAFSLRALFNGGLHLLPDLLKIEENFLSLTFTDVIEYTHIVIFDIFGYLVKGSQFIRRRFLGMHCIKRNCAASEAVCALHLMIFTIISIQIHRVWEFYRLVLSVKDDLCLVTEYLLNRLVCPMASPC